jgi:hypothetical protein
MVRVFAMVAVCGCYAPQNLTGSPCNPENPICPFGQQCVAVSDDQHRCEVGGSGSDDAAIDGPRHDARVDAAPPDAMHSFAYVATVAACIERLFPSPMLCITENGASQLVVDAQDSTTGQPWDAFVRFDLDGAIAGHTVVAVKLELTATDSARAPSDNSGVVWKSSPFTAMDLSMAEPAKVGAAAIAPSQGAVIKLQVVRWPLPTSVVAANAAVYLELESPSVDGVNYWDLTGANPPRLLIDAN